MAKYSDFKCQICLDKGYHGTACPDGRIGCAVFHTKTCSCDIGKAITEKAEFEKIQMSLNLYPNQTLNVAHPFQSIVTASILDINSTKLATKENK
jgi:hypothetical protein